ncbi:MAG: beta-ketoacyl-[acyl-carrier-protein] synthase family protein [Phycisphaerales bacterium]
MKKRVVITGMGWVTPLGHSIETVWERLRKGESGVDRITRFDAETFPTTFAAEVRDYDFRDFVRDPDFHAHARLNAQYALGAAAQAWRQSGLADFDDLARDRVGIYLGAGEGPPDFETCTLTNLAGWDAGDGRSVNTSAWWESASTQVQKWAEIEQEANMPLMHLAHEFGVSGPAYNCLTACAASTQAVGEAMEIIRRGDAEVMIAGGAHTMLHPLGVTGFNRLTALSTRNDSPRTAARPFDQTRDGFVMGEGAGMLILETLEHAKKRGATVLAELIGFGSSADAFRITDIQPDGLGAFAAVLEAFNDAGMHPQTRLPDGRPPVQYISAHGTGTKENDSIETKAMKRVFGDLAPEIPVSSIKSMMGHLIAAAGAVELITCVLAIRDRVLPPTMNLEHRDPVCDLDYVPNAAREAEVDIALSNSFGFGGQNDTLLVRRFEDDA